MNLYWVYDLPNWVFCLLCIFVLAGFSNAALLLTRGYMRRMMGPPPGHNDVVSYYLSAFGVFYGLTVGLIAVATWQNFSDVDTKVSKEAAAVAACYMDISTFPEPARGELQALLREYTRYTIEDAWPIQQKGIIPKGGTERVTAFFKRLADFEPKTESQKLLVAEALGQLNHVIELRRLRLQSVPTGLPATIWTVVLAGAFLNILLTLFFVVENIKYHLWMTTILSTLLGLLIFLIGTMDNPFRGEFSVSAEAFQIVYERLMAPAKVTP